MAVNSFLPATLPREEWEVPAGTLAGAVVIHNVSGRVGVTETARGDVTVSVTTPNGQTLSGTAESFGFVGAVKSDAATVNVDGVFLLPVTGVTAGETVGAGQTGTPQGTAVYGTVSGGAVTGLTLTEGTNTFVGLIYDGRIIGTTAPVQIGVENV